MHACNGPRAICPITVDDTYVIHHVSANEQSCNNSHAEVKQNCAICPIPAVVTYVAGDGWSLFCSSNQRCPYMSCQPLNYVSRGHDNDEVLPWLRPDLYSHSWIFVFYLLPPNLCCNAIYNDCQSCNNESIHYSQQSTELFPCHDAYDCVLICDAICRYSYIWLHWLYDKICGDRPSIDIWQYMYTYIHQYMITQIHRTANRYGYICTQGYVFM